MTVDEMITAFGGRVALASELDLRPHALSRWLHDGVPAYLYSRLALMAHERGIGPLPRELFHLERKPHSNRGVKKGVAE